MSTPRHGAKLDPRYLSSSAAYAPLFFERLREVTNGSPFWAPARK